MKFITSIILIVLCSLNTKGLSKAIETVGTITGPTEVCQGNTGKIYTLTGSSATSGFTWTVPVGATITAGAGTKVITVSFSPTMVMGGFFQVTGNGVNATLTVNVLVKPVSTPVINGPATVCAGQSGVVYNITNMTDVITGVVWVAPTNGTIVSSTNSSATINFSSSFNGSGGPIVFYALNGVCSPGPTVTKSIGLATMPAVPGTISGINYVTPGTTGVTYIVPPIANATTYQWNLPAGASIASGAGTNTVVLDYSLPFAGGNISVQGLNGGCIGPVSSALQIFLTSFPSAAGVISGVTSLCLPTNGTTGIYSIPSIANATSYSWVVTGGATGSSTTNSITLLFPETLPSGPVVISVSGVNSSGEGQRSIATVFVNKPITASGILTGPAAVCQSQNGVQYSSSSIENATSYNWTLPSGVTLASGASTPTVILNFSSTYSGGNISVNGIAGLCGNGPSTLKSAPLSTAAPLAPASITGSAIVCQSETGVIYSISELENASGYVWTVPSGITLVSGQNTNSIITNVSSTYISGNVTAYGTSCQGNGPSTLLNVISRPVPGSPGTITGKSNPCQGEVNVIYSVSSIPYATGYNWTVPAGGTIVSGQNTNSIAVTYSLTASTGNITVQGVNCKGTGTTSTKSISYATAVLGSVGDEKNSPDVDLATGVMRTTVPVFAVSSGDIEIPITLTYSATGVRVTDDDGLTGHNWDLSAQSYRIGRDVRGLPDDYSSTAPGDTRKGWLNGTMGTTIRNLTFTTDNNDATCADELANYNALNAITYTQDTEPDVFYANLPGLSFQFYFDENKQIQVLPYQNIVIVPNTVAGPIASFTVKDSKGVTYTFSELETMSESVLKANDYYLVRQSNLVKTPITYTTSWRLSSVSSPVYGTISFIYKTISTANSDLAPDLYKTTNQYKYRFPIKFNSGTLSSVNYSRVLVTKIVTRISSSVSEVEFISAPKNPSTTQERLNTMNFFDKREGSSKLVSSVSLLYSITGPEKRAFLTTIRKSIACLAIDYTMEYYATVLPGYNSFEKDDWDYYRASGLYTPTPHYSESVLAGTLKKITYPYKGYDVFFYELHDYWKDGTYVSGGGIRLRRMQSYDGVSSSGDRIRDYEYKTVTGQSSGKLQYKAMHEMGVAKLQEYNGTVLRFRDVLLQPNMTETTTKQMFTAKTDSELSHYDMLRSSVVAYERVVVKEKDAGQSIYEFDLPASYGDLSANNNEWTASKVSLARPATGAGGCFELGNIQQGFNLYPFPPHPTYEFAKALIKKETNLREDGTTVRDVTYSYQRVYGNGSSIQKIYGLALEELPTYYYSGSAYIEGKLFLYSRYELFTGVKFQISSKTETLYTSADLSKKSSITTTYFFDSPYHRELAREEVSNSDGSILKTKIKYSADYVITSPSDATSTALVNLNTSHRFIPIETTTSKSIGGTEKIVQATLGTFKTLGGIVYPDKIYSFLTTDGSITLTPASVSAGTTFQFDQSNYILSNTFLQYDSYGNSTEQKGRDRVINSVVLGYSGTLPIAQFSGASTTEVRYSDFETAAPVNFSLTTWPSPTYVAGRNNSVGLNMPIGTTTNKFLYGTITNNSQNYILSVWIKSTQAGTLTVLLGGATNTTQTYSFNASTGYTYYRFKVPLNGITYYVNISSNRDIQIDDVLFYPEEAALTTFTYKIPNGVTSQTDSRGITYYYDYDNWGRKSVLYDRNKNVVKKYEYQVKP